jgi:hypothetical protein
MLPNIKETFAKMNFDDLAEKEEVNEKARIKDEEQSGIDGFKNMIIRKALMADISELSAQERQQILDDPNTRHNNIYLYWPRDPAGKVLHLDDLSGKKTSNGLEMWGATRLDFYTVALSGKKPNVVISSSGSKLAAWMKANGEDTYGPATVLMRRAETEEEPELIYPCDIAQLIKDGEANTFNKSWARNGPGDGKEQADWKLPKPVGSMRCFRFLDFRLMVDSVASEIGVQSRRVPEALA